MDTSTRSNVWTELAFRLLLPSDIPPLPPPPTPPPMPLLIIPGCQLLEPWELDATIDRILTEG